MELGTLMSQSIAMLSDRTELTSDCRLLVYAAYF
eukprot:SAG11_NODE_9371_length_918_cov_1.424908_1_plen_33_part_10